MVADKDAAERAADQLMEALVGDDVLAIDQERCQAMARSPRPTGGTTPSSLLSCSRCQSTRGLTMTRPVPVAARWCQAVALNLWGAIATPTAVCSHCLAK